ncbi:endoglucanase [Paraburkholderia sp. JPY465]|uniref:glycoside hydrolase family 5 protein n=1 Tax=Paraburkholderia sp. JPY465 TaxID=3042285 RepID=UPI003D224341
MELEPGSWLIEPGRWRNFLGTALITVLLGACGGDNGGYAPQSQSRTDSVNNATAKPFSSRSPIWLTIADEGDALTVDAAQTVRFGAGAVWVEKTVNDSGRCDSGFFGKNPLSGAPKVCQRLQSTRGLLWRGVSLAGAEFAPGSLPGNYGSDYRYPTADSVAYYKNKGMNIVRLPFLWERLQPTLNGPFDVTELSRLVAFVKPVTASGETVVLDPHNYARYRGNVIGSSAVPDSAYADFWSRLASQFKDNKRVVFGLMNEPNSMPTEQWLSAANAALAAIRAAGASNMVFVPGNAWTGAHSWTQNWYGTPNATVMKDVRDPGNNFVFEVHQYLDSNSAGSSPDCVSASIGVERLQDFTTWLESNGYHGFLGEIGTGANDTCNQALGNVLAFLHGNAHVWTGFAYWAGGPLWGNYPYSIEPTNGVDKPQMFVLMPYLNQASD